MGTWPQSWLDYRGEREGQHHYRLNTAMLGALATAVSTSAVLSVWPTFLSLIAAGAQAIAISCAAMAGLRRRAPTASLLYVGRVAEMSAVNYQEKFRKATDRELPF